MFHLISTCIDWMVTSLAYRKSETGLFARIAGCKSLYYKTQVNVGKRGKAGQDITFVLSLYE